MRRLAELRSATILAHNYQLPAIQDIADHVGDSLALSRIAAAAPEDTIVFCGVHFMAETAKILSPDKTVLIPDQRAGCSLADSITADELRAWRAEYPDAVVVSYVNTTAEVKALTDICCTSSNAVDVVASITRGQKGAVLPDQFLGAHVKRMTGRKNMQIWAGECHVHAGINGDELTEQARAHPDAELYVHPECGCATSALYLAGEGAFPEDRVHILSTGGMIDAARETRARAGPGRDRDRHAAPIAPRRTRCRLPGRQRPRLLQVHEDDHARRPAALPARRRRRGRSSTPKPPRRPAQRAADDRDRQTRRGRMTPPVWEQRADVVVIGSGVAGLVAALTAHRRGRRVMVLSKATDTATLYAQGGIAVVLPDTDDSIEAHVRDTVAAGGGLCDPDAVAIDRDRRLRRGRRTRRRRRAVRSKPRRDSGR